VTRRLTGLAWLLCVSACSASSTPMAPPGSTDGGSPSQNGGSGATTGGEAANTGGVGNTSAGGAIPTGGTSIIGVSTGGAVTGLGGAPAGGGGSTAPAASILMNWIKSGGNAPEIHLTLPSGASPILASRITLTYRGAGAGQMIQKTDIKFNQAALICPGEVSTGDCTYGSYYQLTPVITVAGTPNDCSYNLSLGNIAHSLVYGTNSEVKLVYDFDQSAGAVGFNQQKPSTWTVLVDGVASMQCSLSAWTTTAGAGTITCGS
jgi:hypothetical protein